MIRGERGAHPVPRLQPGRARQRSVQALGNKITVQESPWDCILMVAINHEKKPFDDKRVRRALTLALDRYEGSKALSQIAIVKEVAGVQVPGTPYATPPAELEKLAGYGRDINAARAEARRLLKEAGAEGFAFTFKNRGIPMPYEPLAIWLIDQWRQIGLNVKQEVIEAAAYYTPLRAGDFQVAMDFQCGYIVEPDLDIYKFISTDKNPANYGRYTDRVLDDLYDKQARATSPEERKKLIRQFEKRLLDEEAHYILTLQWHRIIPHSAKVKGWQITPSHHRNNRRLCGSTEEQRTVTSRRIGRRLSGGGRHAHPEARAPGIRTLTPGTRQVGRAKSDPMTRYLVKRFLLMIPTLLVVVLVFVLLRVIPGDVVEMRFLTGGTNQFLDQKMLDEERTKLGLDRSIGRQFVDYLLGVLRLDLGLSMWTGSPITEEIRLRFALASGRVDGDLRGDGA